MCGQSRWGRRRDLWNGDSCFREHPALPLEGGAGPGIPRRNHKGEIPAGQGQDKHRTRTIQSEL